MVVVARDQRQKRLWTRPRRHSSRLRLEPVPPLGDDSPRFASLSRWPELQAYCQTAWHGLSQWFGAARDAVIPLTMAAHAHVRRSCQAALAVMASGQRARVEVVALVTPRALIQEPERAVITTGLRSAEDRFGRWLNQFVAQHTSCGDEHVLLPGVGPGPARAAESSPTPSRTTTAPAAPRDRIKHRSTGTCLGESSPDGGKSPATTRGRTHAGHAIARH